MKSLSEKQAIAALGRWLAAVPERTYYESKDSLGNITILLSGPDNKTYRGTGNFQKAVEVALKRALAGQAALSSRNPRKR